MQTNQLQSTCHFRRSARAKRIILQVHSERGLEVVLPRGVSKAAGERFLEKHRDWALKHQPTPSPIHLPDTLILRAIATSYQVVYKDLPGEPRPTVVEEGQTLLVFGDLVQTADCFEALRVFCRMKARHLLPTQLYALGKVAGFTVGKVEVRAQKTRWGSCNDRGDIQLNYKLLFLTPQLAQHVMIHELCHTVHMNHSVDFWALVAAHDSNAVSHRKALKSADQWIPSWC